MTLELVMQVSRGNDSRLSGTIRRSDGTETHDFCGTLELMRVFEDLVPPAGGDPTVDLSSHPGDMPVSPGASAPRNFTNP